MRIVFMGTPEFALPSLDMLVNEGYEVAAVVTQPDKPAKRGKKITPPPVKEYAISKGLRVLQPEKIKTLEFLKTLEEIKPDLLITAAYGKILSKEILELPPLGCINVHASLLPKYRGAAPIHWCIINGEKITGITTMYTNEGLDTGDILLKAEVTITDDMTAGELHDKLSVLGAEVLKETLQKLKKNELERIPQDDGEATYAPIITKDIGKIDWSKSSCEIYNLIRGTNPWPGAFTHYKGAVMKVWKSEIVDEEPCGGLKQGTIRRVSKEGIVVCGGKGKINIKEGQCASCRRMCVADYICGNKIDEGEILE